MPSSDARRTRPGALSPGVLAVALVAVLACVGAFVVTSSLVDDGASDDAGSDDAGPVRCWDGDEAASAGACSEPDASRAAFAWVFPNVDLAACSRRVDPDRTVVKCYRGNIEMNLSRWTSTEAALAHYRDDMGGPGDLVEGGRRVWTASTVRFGLTKQKTAATYDEAPWSLTTYADDRAAAVRAQRASWMRPVGQLRATSR